jgi:hypothetical protein
MNYEFKYVSIKLVFWLSISFSLVIIGLFGIVNLCEDRVESLDPPNQYTIIGYTFEFDSGTRCEMANFDALLAGVFMSLTGIWLLPNNTIKQFKKCYNEAKREAIQNEKRTS